MFGLRDAEIVREVARAGGFRAAGEVLRLAPSAVSARIAQIEAALGVVLFDRSRRGARLAPQGRRFVEQAGRLLELRDHIVDDLTGGDRLGATLRIGVAETLVHTCLPDLLARLRAEAPRVRMELSVDISENLGRALIDGAVDIALLLDQWIPRSAVPVPIERVELGWFAAPGVVETVKGPHGLDTLHRHPVVTFARGTPPAREVERLLSEPGAPAPIIHGSSSLATMSHLVAAGMGVGTLPVTLVAGEVAAARMERLAVVPGLALSPLAFSLCHIAPSVAAFARLLAPAR
ncbi:MAG: LysR family transcriptional regulator [Pseudomonadota bacterium]